MKTVRVSLLPLLLAVAAAAATAGGYHLLKKIPASGDGSWDYLFMDTAARRLYVSHGTQVEVVDADSEKWVGKIDGLEGVHGIAIAPEFDRGFITNGLRSTVTIFDRKTLQHISEAPTGNGPDGIVYDPATRRVFAFCRKGSSVTAIDAADGKVAGSIDLGGGPEFPVTDAKGGLWVNLEKESTLLRIDPRKLTVLNRWPVAPCEEPSSMAMDQRNRRLFIGCNNEVMAVANADTGQIITTLPIGPHVDATAFEPSTGLIFNANNGSVTIIHQDSADKYSVVDTVTTQPRANTLALDPQTHKLFLSTAEFEPAAAPTASQPRPRPKLVPGSFTILVFGK